MKELFTALSKAQSEMAGAVKDTENTFFKSTYADLESVWDAIREPLTKNGLSVIQLTETTESGDMNLVTLLCHSSGEHIYGKYPIISRDKNPQSIKSSVTYARRTALSAIVGLHETDDDGNEATAPNRPVPKKEKPSPEKTEQKQETKNEAPVSMLEAAKLYEAAQSARGYGKAETDALLNKQFGVFSATSLKKWQYEKVMEKLNQPN